MRTIVEATWGQVYPATQGLMIHNTPVLSQNAKVTVDGVHELFMSIPLPLPPTEEVTTLLGAKGTFIQWPKEDIILDEPKKTMTLPSQALTSDLMTPPPSYRNQPFHQ